MSKYFVNAPNGKYVHVNLGMGRDIRFEHGTIMENDSVAKQYPNIFIKSSSSERQNEMLVEPAPKPVTKKQREKEEPVLSLEDQILTEPAPKKEVKKKEEKEEEVGEELLEG